MGGVEVQILFKSVSIEEVIAYPTCRKRWQPGGVELELHTFTGTEYSEFVVRSAQHRFYVAVARVISRRMCIRAAGTTVRIGIDRVTGRMQTDFPRVAQKR